MQLRLIALAVMLASRFAGTAIGADDVPSRVASSECLSCHDGTTAERMRPEVSHSYAIDYAASRKHQLKRASESSGLGSTIAADVLVGGRVECSSCHLSHAEETSHKFRLRFEDVTQLCVTCHEVAKR